MVGPANIASVLPWPDNFFHFRAMDLIKKWLSGNRNYIVGAVLYKKFGTDEKLKKLFDGKPDSYLQKRLAEELSALLGKPKVVLQSSPKSTEDGEMPESNDPVLKAFREEWLPLYKRMQYHVRELDRYSGNSEAEIAYRKPIAFEVLKLEQQCLAIWEKRKYYEKHGKLEDAKEFEIPTDPLELGKTIETLKRNIRRNKDLSEKHPGKPNYALRVKKYEEQLQQILNKPSNGQQSSGPPK